MQITGPRCDRKREQKWAIGMLLIVYCPTPVIFTNLLSDIGSSICHVSRVPAIQPLAPPSMRAFPADVRDDFDLQ